MMHSLRKRQKRASDNMPSPPILPPLPALRDVSLDWVLKLSVRCERAAPGFMCHHDIPLRPRWQRPPDEQVSLEREEIYDDPQAYRDLVVSGRASAFDLVLAMLCAFGLETIDTAKKPYPRRSNEGSLQAAGSEGGPVKVSLRDGYATESGPVNGGILGLEYADTTGEVSMGALKQLRVAQLLDKPHASSKSRSSRQGVRKGVSVDLLMPERLASQDSNGDPVRVSMRRAGVKRELQRLHCNAWWVSRACLRAIGGGLPHELKEQILEEARRCCHHPLALPCYYAFHVRCTAIGTARDCLPTNWSECTSAHHAVPLQPVPLVRCVAAQGGCYGGNDVDYEPPDMPAGKAAIDEMNTRMSGCQPFWHTHGGLWCLRAPLFRITARSDETSGELVATSYRRLVHKKKDGFEEWADELGGMPWQEGVP